MLSERAVGWDGRLPALSLYPPLLYSPALPVLVGPRLPVGGDYLVGFRIPSMTVFHSMTEPGTVLLPQLHP